MISIYWPKKKVPDWLFKTEPLGEQYVKPEIHYDGFGVILCVGGYYHVLFIFGGFLIIENGANCNLVGQKSGVIVHQQFFKGCAYIFKKMLKATS